MGEEDRSTPTPLGEDGIPERLRNGNQDGHKLPEVVRGRMLCVIHGLMCYRRISRMGVGEWICPDERHLNPLAGS